jgi:2-polyprenyl-6-methoxyphenol hydroxylase-like FAD-dependent oxidoreductase
VIKKTETVKFFPLFRLPLGGKWARGRRLLLGDAAHAMQPHSGQGVSMALEDAFLLSRLLEASSPTVSLSTLFEKFYSIRRPRVEKFYGYASQRAG